MQERSYPGCFCVLPAWTRDSTQAETSATQEEVGACPPAPPRDSALTDVGTGVPGCPRPGEGLSQGTVEALAGPWA